MSQLGFIVMTKQDITIKTLNKIFNIQEKKVFKLNIEMISETQLEKFKTILINSENTLDKLHPQEDYRENIDHPIKKDKVISHYNHTYFSGTEFVKMLDEKTDIKSVYKDIVSATNLSTVKKLEIFIGISWLNSHKSGAFIPYECELLDDHTRQEDCLFEQVFEPMEKRFTRNFVNAREIKLKCKINKWLDSLEFDYHSMMIRADNSRPCYELTCGLDTYEDPFNIPHTLPCRGSACYTDRGGRRNTPWKPIAVHMLMEIQREDDYDDSLDDLQDSLDGL